jgi:hypothetical protein
MTVAYEGTSTRDWADKADKGVSSSYSTCTCPSPTQFPPTQQRAGKDVGGWCCVSVCVLHGMDLYQYMRVLQDGFKQA